MHLDPFGARTCGHHRTSQPQNPGSQAAPFHIPNSHLPPLGYLFWNVQAPAGSGSHWDPSVTFAEAPWLLHLRAGHHRGGAAATPRAAAPEDQPAVPRLRGHGGPGAAAQVPAAPPALCCLHRDDFQQISGRTWCRIPFSLCLRCLGARSICAVPKGSGDDPTQFDAAGSFLGAWRALVVFQLLLCCPQV